MTDVFDIAEVRMHCPRCGAASTVLSASDVRPGLEYLTLRCTSCAMVFDTQVVQEVMEGAVLAEPASILPAASPSTVP